MIDGENELRDWFETNRQIYLANIKEQRALLDKNMLIFASAVFGFSVTLSERLGCSLLISLVIGIAWLFFTFSIIAVFFSFRASTKASEDFVEQFDENYRNKNYDERLRSKHNDRVPCWNEVAFWTNIIGLILFFTALCLSLFT